MVTKISPDKPFPLGATYDGKSVNFALYSENATAEDLCLFNIGPVETESTGVRLTERSDLFSHIYIKSIQTGQLYESPFALYYNTFIYGVHLKRFTQLNPDIPQNIRCSYAAISHPTTIKYFYLIFNAHEDGVSYVISKKRYGLTEKAMINISNTERSAQKEYQPGNIIHVEGRSVVLIQNRNTNHE